MFERSKHYRSVLPKGSYHSYCKRKLQQHEQETLMNTNSRKHNQSVKSNRVHQHKLSAIQHAQTFQQYLQQFQHQNFIPSMNKPRKMTADPQRSRKISDSKQNKKIENEQIIDSHLPFFKCKLDKSQFYAKRPDFRVKDNKFKITKNIIENNLHNYIGFSLPMRNF